MANDIESRISRLEDGFSNLKVDVEELRKDIAESEDRQMTALADLKKDLQADIGKVHDRLSGLESLAKETHKAVIGTASIRVSRVEPHPQGHEVHFSIRGLGRDLATSEIVFGATNHKEAMAMALSGRIT